jgi:hypothetical protein
MHNPISHSRSCQRDRLLALLKTRAPDWVPLAEVLAVAGAQYGARIHELRALGYRIQNDPGWFRLVRTPAPVLSQPQPTVPQESLFGCLAPETRYPD